MKLSILIGIASGLLFATASYAVDVDPQTPAYKPAGALTGHFKSVGSDTMGALMKQWVEGFKAIYPNVTIEVEAEGSATAPPALMRGDSQLGPMSRDMQEDEINAFKGKFGHPPSHVDVALDALAVYVNKDNPIKCLSVQEVDQIFSKDHWNSNGGNISTWGDTGLDGEWSNTHINMFGRNAKSGTYDVFKRVVLYHGDFKNDVQEQPGSEEVAAHVAADKAAIGYSGIGFLRDGIRAVPLSVSKGYSCYDTSPASVYAGQYPLARYLRVYLNKEPGHAIDPALAEFLSYVLSKDGQTITVKAGFYPIPNEVRLGSLSRLGIMPANP